MNAVPVFTATQRGKSTCRILLPLLICLISACATTPTTSSTPTTFNSEAEELFQRGRYEDAITLWKKVRESYQSTELSTKAELGIANAYFLNKEYIEAAAAYEDFRKLHPKHEQAPFALYRQAISHFNQIEGIDTDQTPVRNSLATLQSYLSLYPAGDHTKEVQDKILICRDKMLQYDLYVAKFYLNDDKYPAVIARLEEALRSYGDLPRRSEILYLLGKTQLKAGQPEKGKAVYQRLVKEFPDSPLAIEANKVLESL